MAPGFEPSTSWLESSPITTRPGLQMCLACETSFVVLSITNTLLLSNTCLLIQMLGY